MVHLTLNTGHVSISPREAVSPEAMATLAPLTAHGGQLPAPFAAFRVTVSHAPGGAVFTVWRGSEPLVTCGLARTPEAALEVWRPLTEMLAAFAPEADPQRPDTLPWLGVVILPSLALTARDDIAWLGDFERCYAHAIMD